MEDNKIALQEYTNTCTCNRQLLQDVNAVLLNQDFVKLFRFRELHTTTVYHLLLFVPYFISLIKTGIYLH